ncbi:uncharacterized protein LOC133523234 [Cydia pomonella]|uniref:uncharacterized protein LOC133523234 n=1 Tax=Cydia pomonella TaxID=82600 RepID=UPI002ADDD13B|nr:uncharacterized protein LOC133523234 [Cydia pomonella]
MRRLVYLGSVVVAAWLYASAALRPPGKMLPNADRMEEIIHLGLFPDKPRNVTFLEYFRSFTDVNENLTKVLERLEFNVLDSENLENVIKLAEEARRLKELKMAAVLDAGRMKGDTDARRQISEHHIPVFNYKNHPYAWNADGRRKIVQLMQHVVYSTRYEINKLHRLRKRYRNSTVFQIGIRFGNQLELKALAGALYSTMEKMPLNVSMLWYVFHYHKLLNIAYDVASNTEFMYLLNNRLKDGYTHWNYVKGEDGAASLPADSAEATTVDPENLYKKKKRK